MEQKELVEYLNQDILSMKLLNFNDSYIQETTRITSKWAKIGFLKGVQDSYCGRNLSVLLENQRLFNESSEYLSVPVDATTIIPVDLWFAQWKRCSIAAIRRVFGEKFIGYDLVSVQSMKKPSEQNLYFSDLNGKTNTTIVSANSRILDVNWNYPTQEFLFEGRKYSTNLDAEFAAIEIFSNKLRDTFTREIIRDLAATAGKSAVFEFENVDLEFQEDALNEIAKKAISKKTGARGLRSILESILLKTMFELPELENVMKVTVDKSSVLGNTDPVITYGKKQSTSAA